MNAGKCLKLVNKEQGTKDMGCFSHCDTSHDHSFPWNEELDES